MKHIGAAVIGVGYLGYHHARILHSMDDTKLIAVVDIDFTRAKEVAEEFGCLAVDDYRKILKEVDCCFIVTPTNTHYKIALDCIKSGKHVFIEKPITYTSDEAISLISLSQEMGVYIQVGHIERFNPVFQQVLKSNTKPLMFHSERLSPFLQRASNIDVTKDLLIHDIDLILSYMRTMKIDTAIKKINAYGVCLITDKPDLVISNIEFKCGITAHIRASRVEQDKKRIMTIYKDDGYVVLDFPNQKLISFKGNDKSFHEIDVGLHEELLMMELRSFVKAIKHKTPVVVPAIEGLEALKVAEEINKALGEHN